MRKHLFVCSCVCIYVFNGSCPPYKTIDVSSHIIIKCLFTTEISYMKDRKPSPFKRLKALCYTLKALESPVLQDNNCLNSDDNQEDFK